MLRARRPRALALITPPPWTPWAPPPLVGLLGRWVAVLVGLLRAVVPAVVSWVSAQRCVVAGSGLLRLHVCAPLCPPLGPGRLHSGVVAGSGLFIGGCIMSVAVVFC